MHSVLSLKSESGAFIGVHNIALGRLEGGCAAIQGALEELPKGEELSASPISYHDYETMPNTRATRRKIQDAEQKIRELEARINIQQQRNQSYSKPVQRGDCYMYDWNCVCGYLVYHGQSRCPRCSAPRSTGVLCHGSRRGRPVQPGEARGAAPAGHQPQHQAHKHATTTPTIAPAPTLSVRPVGLQQRASTIPYAEIARRATAAPATLALDRSQQPAEHLPVQPSLAHVTPPAISSAAQLLDDDETAQMQYDGDETFPEIDEANDPKRIRARIRGVEASVERKLRAIERKENEIEEQQRRVQEEQAKLDQKVVEIQTVKEQLHNLQQVAAELAARQAELAAQRARSGADVASASNPAASTVPAAAGSIPEALWSAATVIRSTGSSNPQIAERLELLLQQMGSLFNETNSPPPPDPTQPTIGQVFQRQQIDTNTSTSAHTTPPPMAVSISTPPPSRDPLFQEASKGGKDQCLATKQLKDEADCRLASDDMWEDTALKGTKRAFEEVQELPQPPMEAQHLAVEAGLTAVSSSHESSPLQKTTVRQHAVDPLPQMRIEGALNRIVQGASKNLDTVPGKGRPSPY